MPIIKATRKRSNKGGPPKKGTHRTRKILSTGILSIAQKTAVRHKHNRNLRVARSRFAELIASKRSAAGAAAREAAAEIPAAAAAIAAANQAGNHNAAAAARRNAAEKLNAAASAARHAANDPAERIVVPITQRIGNIVESKLTKKRKRNLKIINNQIKEFINDEPDDENENERSEYDEKVQRIIAKIPKEFLEGLNANNSDEAEEIINNFIDHIDDVMKKYALVPPDLFKRMRKIQRIILSSSENSSSADKMSI